MSTADQSGATAQLAAALAGRYAIERQIGEGGMATVYLAREFKHNRHVALKVLHPELGAVLGKERFLSEIQLTASLQHPHILPLFDSGEAEGLLYYTMPYVAGESLRTRLDRERQLPIDEGIAMVVAVAGALDHAHRSGVIHRDLKPENILLADGEPVVADFGIALAISKAGGARITQSGISLGTPQYMSPEQATGDRQLDARSDIYSLAAVAYELLTGEPPHSGGTAQAVIARVVTERPRSIRVTRPSVPASIEAAVLQGLEKIPADRFANAQEFADALQGRGVRTFAIEPTAVTRSPQEKLRDPLLLSLAAVALIAVTISGWTLLRAARGGPVEPVRFILDTGGENPGMPGVSPDGRHVAYSYVGRRGLMLHPLREGRAHPLAGTEEATTLAPAFSPDGKWIAFNAGNELKRISVEGADLATLADSVIQDAPSWSDDGIVFARSDGLFIVPAAGGRARRLTVLDSTRAERAHLAPYSVPGANVVVFVVRADGRTSELAVAPRLGARVPHKLTGIPATRPVAAVDRWLLYMSPDNADLFAVEFDARGRNARGAPVHVFSEDTHGWFDPHLSRAGMLVYRRSAGANELVDVDERGNTRPLLQGAPQAGSWRSPMYPRVSPTGRSLAFSAMSQGVRDIWIYDFREGQGRRLTRQRSAWEPQWTPDGRRIVFTSDSGGSRRLWWQSIDGRGSAQVLEDADSVFTGHLAGDGRILVYATESGDVWVMDFANRGEPRPLLTGDARETMPRLSPDGRWLAFVADYREPGNLEVYVMPFAADGEWVQISAEGGTEPVWSPDGSRLFYRAGDSMVEAQLRLAPSIAVTARRVLFSGSFDGEMGHVNYDVTSDARRFLMVQQGDRQPQIVGVLNWLENVRRRLRDERR